MTLLSEPLRARMGRILDRRLEFLRMSCLMGAIVLALAGQGMAVGADPLSAEDKASLSGLWFWSCSEDKTVLL